MEKEFLNGYNPDGFFIRVIEEKKGKQIEEQIEPDEKAFKTLVEIIKGQYPSHRYVNCFFNNRFIGCKLYI